MLTDLPLDQLRSVTATQVDPPDFDEFWATTLAESAEFDLDVVVEPVSSPVETLDLFDVTFTGFSGQRVKAWLRVPRGSSAPLPAIVEFVGYGGGRGLAEGSLFWASAGFAHFHMDTRGQGATWSVGDTPDLGSSGPRLPGMMTNGIQDKHSYYFRRLITDAVRAIDAAAGLPQIDSSRLTSLGTSQGGGLALAAAGLSPRVESLVSYVPFLCDFPRAIMITDSNPYKELSDYLSVHRHEVGAVFDTLSYFDGVNFAKRASAPAWFTTALMDPICPPSTVFAAFNNYAGPKEIEVWPFNSHEGGSQDDDLRIHAILRQR